MKITFLGATQTVTGSKYLIEEDNYKVLIDCGLFQGHKEMREMNWQKLPIDPRNIDAVILTHAHIDHSGYIPLLVKRGFKGKIYCSGATYDLCKIMLPDSGYLQEEDANNANRHQYSKHKPALPLYTEREAVKSLGYFSTVEFGKRYSLGGNLSFQLSRAGHILGSAIISLSDGHKTIVFSGDLGREENPVMKSPAVIDHADYIVVESTYGNRLHSDEDTEKEIAKAIKETIAVGGNVIIPAFAVGRTQAILYYLYRLKKTKQIPHVPIYLDSPMAINVTDLLHRHCNEHSLSKEECEGIHKGVNYTRTVNESKAIGSSYVPSIIISASGMLEGGRVLHHLKRCITDKKNTILLVGFQAEGTRGERLQKGEKEIKIHGDFYPLKAKVAYLSSMSAHADYQDILNWLSNFRKKPAKLFVTHGEKEAANSLKDKVVENLGWQVVVPEYGYSEEL